MGVLAKISCRDISFPFKSWYQIDICDEYIFCLKISTFAVSQKKTNVLFTFKYTSVLLHSRYGLGEQQQNKNQCRIKEQI